MEHINILREKDYVNQTNLGEILLRDKVFLGLPVLAKRIRNNYVIRGEQVYWPFWFIKIKAVADRPPFKPKIRVYFAYIDAISSDYGLTNEYPVTCETPRKTNARECVIAGNRFHELVEEVIEKKIFKNYVIKRPSVHMSEHKLVHLSFYETRVRGLNGHIQQYLVNAVSGEAKKMV